MNAFNPQATLTEIRALRHTDRESARSKMDQLKCDLATMREAGAATLNLMIRKIDDTHVSRKSLVKTVDENAHLLGDDLSGIFMSGIEQYMNVRKRLKKFLKQNGDTGVLAFVHSRYNNDEDDSSEDQRGVTLEDKIGQIAKHARVTLGPVNYNIEIDNAGIEMLGVNIDDTTMGGACSGGGRLPYSLILTDRSGEMSKEEKLIRLLGVRGGFDLATKSRAAKTIDHENRHHIDCFVEKVIAANNGKVVDQGASLGRSILHQSMRLKKLEKMSAPDKIIQRDRTMLMKSIGLLGVSAAEESDEIKPEYLQEAAMKIVSDEVRREIVAYVHGGGDEGAATLTHLINSYAIPTLAVYDGVLTDEDKGKIVTRLCEVTNDAIKAAKEITEISGGNLTMLAYEPIENWPRIVRQYRQADKLRNSTARTE